MAKIPNLTSAIPKMKSNEPIVTFKGAETPVTNERIWEKLLEIEKKILELQHGS